MLSAGRWAERYAGGGMRKRTLGKTGLEVSELVLGRILADVDAPLVLSTKLGGRPRPFFPRSKEHLLRSAEESLRLLHREVIDILFIHEPDRPLQYDWWSDPESA